MELRTLMSAAGLEIRSIENPLWAASVVAQGVVTLLHRFASSATSPTSSRPRRGSTPGSVLGVAGGQASQPRTSS